MRRLRGTAGLLRSIGGDEVYGNNSELTKALEDLGETFLMNVSSALKVWDEDLRLQPPAAACSRLQPPARQLRRGHPHQVLAPENCAARLRSVADLTAKHFEKRCRLVTLRQTTKEPFDYRVWVQEVWIWDESSALASRRLLIVRQEADGSHKYSLSNAAADTDWERWAYCKPSGSGSSALSRMPRANSAWRNMRYALGGAGITTM